MSCYISTLISSSDVIPVVKPLFDTHWIVQFESIPLPGCSYIYKNLIGGVLNIPNFIREGSFWGGPCITTWNQNLSLVIFNIYNTNI